MGSMSESSLSRRKEKKRLRRRRRLALERARDLDQERQILASLPPPEICAGCCEVVELAEVGGHGLPTIKLGMCRTCLGNPRIAQAIFVEVMSRFGRGRRVAG